MRQHVLTLLTCIMADEICDVPLLIRILYCCQIVASAYTSSSGCLPCRKVFYQEILIPITSKLFTSPWSLNVNEIFYINLYLRWEDATNLIYYFSFMSSFLNTKLETSTFQGIFNYIYNIYHWFRYRYMFHLFHK